MVILKRRSRLVTFRVSAEEYEHLSNSCVASGARSISEFARLAVLRDVEARQPTGALSGDLATLSKELSELDVCLSEIRRRIHGVLGPTTGAKEANGATVD
jgi:hypothetical protein